MIISPIVCWISFVDKLSKPTVHFVFRFVTTFFISYISVGCMKKFTEDLSFKCEWNEVVGEGTDSLIVLPIFGKEIIKFFSNNAIVWHFFSIYTESFREM